MYITGAIFVYWSYKESYGDTPVCYSRNYNFYNNKKKKKKEEEVEEELTFLL